MMLRIREYNKETDSLNLLSVIDLKESDISETVKTLKFFKDNNLYISINKDGSGDSSNNPTYSIEYIEFEFPNTHLSLDKQTIPCITIDVIEELY